MKKKAHKILENLRTHILSKHFKNNHRSTDKDFTRNCLLKFPDLILFILNLVRRSLQSELNSFTKMINLVSISKQAFSAARKKILPTAFVELNKMLVHELYTDNKVQTYLGFRLIAIDGSTLQLPEGESIKEKYGICSDNMSMARTSHAYDVLSGITLDAIMRPYSTPERSMAFDHILSIPSSNSAKDLYIFDRGYPSVSLLYLLHSQEKDFVMRVSKKYLSVVNDVLAKGKRDAVVKISPSMIGGKQLEDFKELFPNVDLKSSFKVRVLVVDLSTGEEEILITSLLDKTKHKYKIFKKLYHLRWGIEENYKFHKVRIEIENFSGKTPHAIEQDFNASIFTANIRTLVAREAQDELDQVASVEHRKHAYVINKNISISVLKDNLVKALFNPKVNLIHFCTILKQNMKISVVPIRPGRQYEHIKKSSHKYPMNRRRAI